MNIRKYILPLLALAALSACNQEEINTDVHGVSDEELRAGGLSYGAALQQMQQRVIPIGSPALTTGPGNDLQNTDLISSGSYIGYFGCNNNWGNRIEASWNMEEGRMKYAYENFYSKISQPWLSIYQLAKDSQSPSDRQALAVANVIKNFGWLRATDVFGPIVYTTAGDGNLTPTPESQELVYKAMLQELDKCVEVLKNAEKPILARYDLIYDGDPKKWTKLANSLMLRIAVRTHFKNAELARTYIVKALDAANGGVIEQASDEAKLGSSSKLPLRNPFIASVEEYGETRMGATIWSYLDGYKDPRLDKYFTAGSWNNSPKHWALPPTANYAKAASTIMNSRFYASKPKVSPEAPIYWFRASETYFLKAEAALFGFIPEEAETLYNNGIKMSFVENGLSEAEATTYLERENGNPTALTARNSYSAYFANITKGNVSVKWSQLQRNDEQEEKLQKIMTQKYLALYPNAVEAWTEYRRTGYPLLMAPEDGAAPSRVGLKYNEARTPERFRFPAESYSTNPNNAVIPQLLGGEDQGGTPLWWVRDNRPKQTN